MKPINTLISKNILLWIGRLRRTDYHSVVQSVLSIQVEGSSLQGQTEID